MAAFGLGDWNNGLLMGRYVDGRKFVCCKLELWQSKGPCYRCSNRDLAT